MLEQANAIPNIGVKNLEAAKEFYQNKLGLEPVAGGDENVQLFKSGTTTIEVYKSDFAGSNKATAMSWMVGDEIEKDVEALRNKGVEFEHYQLPDAKLDGDSHVMKDMKAAWFKDPDGNILCLHNK